MPRRKQTHCGKGHEFDEPNTYYYRGKRYCRACRNVNSKAEQKRVRELARIARENGYDA